MTEFYLYLSTTFWKWVALTITIDGVLALLNRFTTFEVPRKVFVWITGIGIFFAGYQAWLDEHRAHMETQNALVAENKKTARLTAQLEEVRSTSRQATKEEIQKAAAQLWRFVTTTKLEGGNAILLDEEPVPEIVKVIINGIQYNLEEKYGLQLEGKKIILSNPGPGFIPFLDVVNNEFVEGEPIKVEYMKRIQ